MNLDKQNFYSSRYLATVRFDNDRIIVEGGREEKQNLKLAKKETSFCYVKDLTSKQEVRLELVGGEWVRGVNS